MKQKGLIEPKEGGSQQSSKSLSKLTLVAEEPAPSLLAVALPGLLAGAVEAARVTDTVVTVTPTEAHATPGNTTFIKYRSEQKHRKQ